MIDLNTKFGRFVRKQLKSRYFIWLTTVDSNGMPQPRPVWFLWKDNSILVYSLAKTFKLQHIQGNPNVSLHFNTEDEAGENRIVILTGIATFDKQTPPANKHRAYMRKYRSGIRGLLKKTPKQFSQNQPVAIRIIPIKMRGWE